LTPVDQDFGAGDVEVGGAGGTSLRGGHVVDDVVESDPLAGVRYVKRVLRFLSDYVGHPPIHFGAHGDGAVNRGADRRQDLQLLHSYLGDAAREGVLGNRPGRIAQKRRVKRVRQWSIQGDGVPVDRSNRSIGVDLGAGRNPRLRLAVTNQSVHAQQVDPRLRHRALYQYGIAYGKARSIGHSNAVRTGGDILIGKIRGVTERVAARAGDTDSQKAGASGHAD